MLRIVRSGGVLRCCMTSSTINIGRAPNVGNYVTSTGAHCRWGGWVGD